MFIREHEYKRFYELHHKRLKQSRIIVIVYRQPKKALVCT